MNIGRNTIHREMNFSSLRAGRINVLMRPWRVPRSENITDAPRHPNMMNPNR